MLVAWLNYSGASIGHEAENLKITSKLTLKKLR